MASFLHKWCVGVFFLLATVGAKGVSAPPPHPFYVSITEINHNAGEQVLEISVKLFFDDLEKVLSAQHKVMVDLIKPKDKAQVNGFVGKYLQQHLMIRLDGKPVALEFLGYEVEREAAWCYLQVEQISSVKRVDITNDIFLQQYPTQINMMHVTVKGQRKSMRLNNPDSKTSFEF